MILGISLLVLTVLFIALAIHYGAECEDGAAGGCVALALVFLIGACSVLSCSIHTSINYSELAAQRKSLAIMEKSIEATKKAVYDTSKKSGLGIDIENKDQSTNWSEAIKKYTEMVTDYNTRIARARALSKIKVLKIVIPKMPDELTLIESVNF